jgi:hypothetical protein
MDQPTAQLDRQLFTNGGIVYCYDFDLITFEQAQMANEVMQFKKQSIDKPPKSIRDLVISGSAEYMARTFAFLVTRLDANGQPEQFVRVRTYDAALAFVQALPVSMWQKVEECIVDFFGRTGKAQLASSVLSHESELDVSAIVSSILQGAVANAAKNDDDSSNDSSATNDSMLKANSAGASAQL